MMKKYKLVILRNENEMDYLPWTHALREFSDHADYTVVDLTRKDWLEEISHHRPDYLLAKPGGFTAAFRQLYDERSLILARELNYPLFPTLDEILIYENKRYLSYWLQAHDIPHPETNVFYYRKEALAFLDHATFPVVGKMNTGASGKGVRILLDKKQAAGYINEAFGKGIRSRSGPRLDKAKLVRRILNKIKDPAALRERIKTYRSIASDYQKNVVILQQFIAHDYEWRVVRIGDSFFAHKKLVKDGFASGSLLKSYVNPPPELLDFVREITGKYGFYSQAIDLFEPSPGNYLVNEMQCIFGQSDPWQMKVNDVPGRYIHKNGQWIFEAGDFNRNQSFNLRVEYVLSRLRESEEQ
jgi:glutathione synthase/RimK-type ligase-like ATP-grasp enzyme